MPLALHYVPFCQLYLRWNMTSINPTNEIHEDSLLPSFWIQLDIWLHEDNGKGVIIGIFLLYTEKLQPGVRLCKYHPKKLNNKIE